MFKEPGQGHRRRSVAAAVGDPLSPPHRPVLTSTNIYVVVTAATGNVALIVAAAVMGVIFALERRTTGSILASTITHLGWSTLMIFCLPR